MICSKKIILGRMPGCLSVQLEFCFAGVGVGVGLALFLQKLFIYVILRVYFEFQCSTMPGAGQKVCGGGGGGVVA